MAQATPYGFDLGASIGEGIRNATGVQQLRSMRGDQQRQEVLRSNTPQALAGDQDALKSIMTADPESGMKMQTFIQNASKAQLERVTQSADIMGRMATMIGNAPDEEIVQAYAWGLDNAKKSGIDISTAPRTNDPQQIRQYTKFLQGQALSVKDQMPKLEGIYDSSGRDQKVMINPITGDFKNIGGPQAARGTSFSYDPEGGFSFFEGVDAPKGQMRPLDKAANNTVEKNIIDGAEALTRMNDIAALWKPEFSTLQGQGNSAWLGVKAKSGGLLGKVSPQEEADLGDFAAYRASVLTNLNRTIKEITGTAASPGEAERIRLTLPDAGEGMFDGDDPVSFKSKMDKSIRDLKLAIARQTHHRTRGMSGNPWDTIGLAEMPLVMSKREIDIKAEIKKANPEAHEGAIRAQVRTMMKQEFGL